MARTIACKLEAKTGLVSIEAQGRSRKDTFLILPHVRMIDGVPHISVREDTSTEASKRSQYVLVAKEGETFNESPGTPGLMSISHYDIYLGNFEKDGAVYHVYGLTPDKDGW